MKEIEDEVLNSFNRFMKRIFKSLLYTLLVYVVSMWGLCFILQPVFGEMAFVISLCIGIIFTIIFCALIIIDEIRMKK